MKLEFVEVCGFRGYAAPVRFQFGSAYTVLDGRNGTGKSSLFDAVEFALTGTISKYENASASGQNVDDYIWWRGPFPATKEKYVEVGFSDSGKSVSIRRNQASLVSGTKLDALQALLCDSAIAPGGALAQLCTHAIVRDEQITRLSLDLKETDRYALLRASLGATDADEWISRAHLVAGLAKERLEAAKRDVEDANSALAVSTRALDQIRVSIIGEVQINSAVQRLQRLTESNLPADQLISRARGFLVRHSAVAEKLRGLLGAWTSTDSCRKQVAVLQRQLVEAQAVRDQAITRMGAMPPVSAQESSSNLSRKARAIANLVQLGKDVGYTDGHCPLCSKNQSEAEFALGMDLAMELARSLDKSAVASADLERRLDDARREVAQCEATIRDHEKGLNDAKSAIAKYEADLIEAGFERDASESAIRDRLVSVEVESLAVQQDVRVLDTLSLNRDLERIAKELESAKQRSTQAQARLSAAVTTDASAKALHDATRRAASETLEVRLERVLPLMAELYRRLRPHPVWSSLEYAIRGDVRRFLKLQVGNGLNPQFMFSSGQRRATGLAFLLSVNLSLAWSKFKTIMLDDPVQHVDDFRAVHLAEVCAHLIAQGRQVICAVEDEALADLFCRRWPASNTDDAKRISIGADKDANIAILSERWLTALPRDTLLAMPKLAAG
jgi:chromosome segregation protein